MSHNTLSTTQFPIHSYMDLCSNTVSSNLTYNTNHPVSNCFTSQLVNMNTSPIRIPSIDLFQEAVNYSLSPSLYTNPSIHVNITDVNNDSVNHSTSHPVIQLRHSLPQYDSLFLQYHNYVSRYNREMNSEQVNALTTTGTKLKMLHRNHKYPPHQYQYHDHHRHHHTHPQPDLHDMQLCKGVMRMGAEEEEEGEEGGGGGGEPKPNFSYIGLIAKAILSTQERRMILSEIYQWIQSRYAYFRTRGPGWRNSIRHNLSLNDCFVKVGRATNGKGHYWGIHPANLKDFLCGDFRRRRAQRKITSPTNLMSIRDSRFCDNFSGNWSHEEKSSENSFDQTMRTSPPTPHRHRHHHCCPHPQQRVMNVSFNVVNLIDHPNYDGDTVGGDDNHHDDDGVDVVTTVTEEHDGEHSSYAAINEDHLNSENKQTVHFKELSTSNTSFLSNNSESPLDYTINN
ncbi:unnamed protein product [Heterobilharzia americana]|nr:unnamed protein product [Heterobilharzia americana]